MVREHRFPVDVSWNGGMRVTGWVQGKPLLPLATPLELHGSDPERFSPEDLLVAAAASCLAVTIAALAQRQQLPLYDLDIHAEGVVGRRPDGRFGFTRIEQTVELETEPEHEAALRAVVAKAEASCLVSVSLALPVDTAVRVRTPVA